MKVLISTSSFGECGPEPLKTLGDAGIEIVLPGLGRTLKENEIARWAADCAGIIAGTEPLTGEVLRGLSRLKVISRVGAGLDNVDITAANELGIAVYNTPDGPTQAVAELTIALILDLLRGISRADSRIRAGVWKKETGSLLGKKRLGVIGLGRIGRLVAMLALAFGAEVVACDICADEAWASDRRIILLEKEALLATADIVTLHVPCEDKERPLIGEDEIGLMKEGAFLVNASRGGLVDEEALLNALKQGHLGGAALDTFDREPYTGPLTALENVVLSPHVGSYAREARAGMEIGAVVNLLAGLARAGLIGSAGGN